MSTGPAALRRTVAVFVDAENLFKGYGKLVIPPVPMSEIIRRIVDAAEREAGAGRIAVARAYADWNNPGLAEYQREVELSRVTTVQVFPAGIQTKNAADIQLVVDSLKYADDESLEVFAIVSGDGDFVPLVRRLHELGKYVVGATLEGLGTNTLLRGEADLFLQIPVPPRVAPEPVSPPPVASVEKKAPKKAAPKRARKGADKVVTKPTEAVVEAPVEKPVKKAVVARRTTAKKATSQPLSAPAQKNDWHALAQKITLVQKDPVGSAEEYKSVIDELLAQPRFQSYCDRLCDNGGALPRLAMAIKVGAPQMSPSDAGVRNLSRALRFALAGTRYALAQGDDEPQPVLVRRSSKSPSILPDLTIGDLFGGSAGPH